MQQKSLLRALQARAAAAPGCCGGALLLWRRLAAHSTRPCTSHTSLSTADQKRFLRYSGCGGSEELGYGSDLLGGQVKWRAKPPPEDMQVLLHVLLTRCSLLTSMEEQVEKQEQVGEG